MLNPKPQRHVLVFQVIVALGMCFLWRLSHVFPPNVEPVLGTTMPFARRYGALIGLLFASLSMVLYDLATSGVTQWTIITAVTYGLIGFAAPLFVRGKRSVVRYVLFAILATIFFDAITGVAAGAVLYGMSWKVGFVGQIPFTINHLIGNVLLAATLSPVVDFLLLKQLTWLSPPITASTSAS